MPTNQDTLVHEQEGVIKYHLVFHEQALSDDLVEPNQVQPKKLAELVAELNTARSVLKAQALIGQDPLRYGGDGFGNISIRTTGLQFLISGSQTGHLASLTANDLALVEDFNVQQNRLCASGLTKPSSESMTHGVCFQSNLGISAVIHVHSPDIWQAVDTLAMPFTDASIAYGTPQMAKAVEELLAQHDAAGQPIIFAMKGHEDGIVAAGKSLASCTSGLLEYYKQSILLKRYS